MSQDDSGKWTLNRSFFCTDLPGSTPLDMFSAPYAMTTTGGVTHGGGNIPDRWELLTVRGIDLWCKSRDVEPWPPSDAVVLATYDSDSPPIAGFGPPTIEVGSTLEQSTTVFDAANLALAWASRAIIKVDPPTANAGEDPQYPEVPILVPKPSIVITRETSTSPEADADRFVGRRNSVIWRTYPIGTVLCYSIVGRNAGDGIWQSTYQFARDPSGKFLQVIRWKDSQGRFPALTITDVSTRKGIKDVNVQGEDDFNAMGI